MSLARQNFAPEIETAINAQINNELRASHAYLSMAAYFGRDSVALKGFEKFFQNSAHEEREHADKFIQYQNMRGGKVVLGAIVEPEVEWKSARNALETALQMEKEINKALLTLHALADTHNDPQLTDFLESEFLEHQVKSIKEISDLLTNLNRVGADGLGLFLFDKELHA